MAMYVLYMAIVECNRQDITNKHADRYMQICVHMYMLIITCVIMLACNTCICGIESLAVYSHIPL